jgi:hypothetical protein
MSRKILQPKIIFLITGSTINTYSRLRHLGQEKTWVKDIDKFPNIEYRYLISNGNKLVKHKYREDLHTNNLKRSNFSSSELIFEKSDELIFDASLGWESILSNLIAGIDWALDCSQNFDFIIRTNVSSYWDLNSTIRLIEKLPMDGVYAGHVVKALDCEFVAGDGIILSRDVASSIAKNAQMLDASVIDDVAIGRLAQVILIPFTHIPRRWVRTRFDVNHPDLKLGNTHLFRCKFERVVFKKIFRRDITLMKLLHEKFRDR